MTIPHQAGDQAAATRLWRAVLLIEEGARRIMARDHAAPCTPALPCPPGLADPVCTRCALDQSAVVLAELYELDGVPDALPVAHATADALPETLGTLTTVAALQRAVTELRYAITMLTHNTGETQ